MQFQTIADNFTRFRIAYISYMLHMIFPMTHVSNSHVERAERGSSFRIIMVLNIESITQINFQMFFQPKYLKLLIFIVGVRWKFNVLLEVRMCIDKFRHSFSG